MNISKRYYIIVSEKSMTMIKMNAIYITTLKNMPG